MAKLIEDPGDWILYCRLIGLFAVHRDEEGDDTASQVVQQGDGPALSGVGNPFLDVPNVTGATEFKKGYVMRKSCYDANGKKSNDIFVYLYIYFIDLL